MPGGATHQQRRRWPASVAGALPAVGLALALVLLAGCGDAGPQAPIGLPVYFTCDTQGRLEPCGCFKGQFGGLTRLKTVLDAEAPAHALRVDVGDSIGGAEDYDLVQYKYMLQAFAAMKYDAVNAGHREARLALDQLRELKRSAPVPLLSANLVEKIDAKPVLEPWRLVERGGLRIALVGLVEPRGLGDDLGAGLAVADMATTLAQLLPELRSKIAGMLNQPATKLVRMIGTPGQQLAQVLGARREQLEKQAS